MLDVAIGIDVVVLMVVWSTGAMDVAWLRATAAAKPILVLWTLGPIRLTLHWCPHPVSRVVAMAEPGREAARAVAVRMPAASRTRPFTLPFEAVKVVEPIY